MLLLYKKSTGHIVGTNNSPLATFENMYPHATEEFKQMYGGLVVEDDPEYDRNRQWYKVEDDIRVVRLESPWIEEQVRPPDPGDQRILDLELAVAAILGGAS
ncbi:hypothetical protein [Candidatus Formimonas warabiya]|uniref:Uncharacterized protein n=1 Tax=Formimonas warabiya TaxID=1761012 RepID=A0A3G1KP01_FORW1|nr:hypothetical protein [Candidatus Formimonas warabiya]ATW24189.1 hypothetical protein DCMF_04765 [Candidatus Formimonas warabiya]